MMNDQGRISNKKCVTEIFMGLTDFSYEDFQEFTNLMDDIKSRKSKGVITEFLDAASRKRT